MTISISANILALKGQCVNQIEHNEALNKVIIHCHRDKRFKAIDPLTGITGTIKKYVRRSVQDLPICGLPCSIEIELAQVWTGKNERRIEACDFVYKGNRYTKRFCQLVSGLCRHMSIQAVSRHLGVRCELTAR